MDTVRLKQRIAPRKNIQQLRVEFYENVDQNRLTPREAVRQFRIMVGKTQEEFADFAGVSLKSLRDLEQGIGNQTLKTVEKLLYGSGLKLTVGRRSER